MHKIIFSLLFCSFITSSAVAQKKKKKNKKTASIAQSITQNLTEKLQKHISIIASDSFEGRRTGTPGELLAADYIKSQFIVNGIKPKGNNETYFQTFDINEGIKYEESSFFYINDNLLQAGKDFYPLNQSNNAEANEVVAPILKDHNTIWFLDLKEELKKNETNPHYDISPYINDRIKHVEQAGATGLLVINTSKQEDNLAFDAKGKKATATIPVIYLSKEIVKKYLKDANTAIEVKFKIDIQEKKRVGTNVLAYIDNQADKTIIIGAHYDHLGYGEDKNSLYAGKEKMIHNGADDNASGVAALIELSRILKAVQYTNNNYLFIAFSGEELGLYGSKYFTENPTIAIDKANYMVNMDMIGRLNDSTKAFTVGGFGTSPTWGNIIQQGIQTKDSISIKIDSSGTGPSDHSSFYRKNIPVLFFFTGTHGDYHKPGDDIDKINFGGEDKIVQYIVELIKKTDNEPKLVFTKTRENSSGGSSTRFTVSLGIMPDYTYTGTGVRADGISEGKLAQRIGVQAGDVVIKLGEFEINSVESYMKVLGKFKKGDSTKLITTRNGKEISYDITF